MLSPLGLRRQRLLVDVLAFLVCLVLHKQTQTNANKRKQTPSSGRRVRRKVQGTQTANVQKRGQERGRQCAHRVESLLHLRRRVAVHPLEVVSHVELVALLAKASVRVRTYTTGKFKYGHSRGQEAQRKLNEKPKEAPQMLQKGQKG